MQLVHGEKEHVPFRPRVATKWEMAKGDSEGAATGMDMENSAHNQPVITGLAPEAMLSRQNLARSAPARECRQRGFGRGR